MDEIVHRISAWDGFSLVVREWRDGNGRTPLLCLPGIVRTSGDFETFAHALGTGRRVVAPDYAGRGQSGRSRDIVRYAPEACLRDICAALHLHRPIAIGTSFGGLLSMGLATARPSLLRAVVLNDIGPEIGSSGTEFVRRFVRRIGERGHCPPCFVAIQRQRRQHRAQMRNRRVDVGKCGFMANDDGVLRPVWDTRIARLVNGETPDLWALFGGLAHLPLLLVRGEASDILLPATVTRMQAVRPDMLLATLPGIGHAPTLTEPEVLAALQAFVDGLQ